MAKCREKKSKDWLIGDSDEVHVWSAFTRGYHFNLYDKPFENPSAEGPEWRCVWHSVAKAVEYAGKLDMVSVTPREDLASTRFCLAKPGSQYVVYQPDDGPIMISGLLVGMAYDYELYDVEQSKVVAQERIRASGSSESFGSVGQGSVLYIERNITQ